MKEDYKLKEEIKASLKYECILCGAKDCIKSHSISKKQYLNKIAEEGHVYGSFREKGMFNLSKISINEASTFNNFCQKCDAIFSELDNKDFDVNNTKQIFIMYYRMLSAQVHQIKEEIIFFEKNIDNPNAKTQVNLRTKALKKYNNKLNYFKELLEKEEYNIFNTKVIMFNFEVPFLYFNIVNMLFDYEGNNIPERNEVVINLFSQGNKTYLVLVWEKENDIYLSKYLNQVISLNQKELQVYITNLIIAFPFNFYIRPSYYLKWTQKCKFECMKEVCSKIFFKYNKFLFNVFLKEEILNIFLLDSTKYG